MEKTDYNSILDLDIIFPIINGKVSMAINRMMYRNFKKVGLDITPEQWTVLSFLWKEDGVSQQKLCDATFKDKPSMTRLIDNLVKQDMVVRRTPPNDRRSNLIYLTVKARSIQSKAEKAVLDTTKLALKGVDDEGMSQVRNILKIVFDNIQEALNDK
ncbi:MarR family winged helix-turn-helix transcriptional regulator [Dysgonomonas sp. 520]|uniref:MarR family winged helix-turn-helix transcriptional regulator n=1 Tax=Dysgonomonas sp. 520 TaxID=2302931 RepID=UPI0013D53EE3|nr:MarR family transcriptional regulator [Dysgonomonas sp. 520]NDW11204.1 MarR family transcriptional regulator [Dysgonomonas sp. 520]